MITEDVVLNLAMNPAGYLSGSQQVQAASQQMQASMSNVLVTTSLLRSGLDVVTPKRAALAGWAAFASEAGKADEVLQQMTANSTVTNVNVGKLHRSINEMARGMPVGIQNSRAVVTQFSQMGVASEGTEKKVGSLSKTIFQLAGASGEGPQQLAQGMVELSRVTGNRNLDPRRFRDLSDSITTVSKTSGASAGSVISFSQSIAPMATQAGIGATAVAGISAAFSVMGQDGGSAATAVNRMLIGMSRAARDGGEQMSTYADITGKTREEFEKLFKLNPTEALVQVTEAIGAAGPRGARMLESLGLDSIRTMPALTALSQSGQLRSTVNTAVAGYGSGSTSRASDAAFEGFFDQLSKTGESARQLGEALGTPLLGPLETFASALQGPIDLLRQLAESPLAQGAMKAGSMAGMGAGLWSRVLGPLGALALGRQALTSGPVASLMGGLSRGRGDGPGVSRMSRFGARATQYYDTNGFRGPLAGFNQRVFRFGQSMGEGREQGLQERMTPQQYAARQQRLQTGQGPRGGRGIFGRMAGGAAMMGTVYGDLLRSQFEDASENDFNRRDSGMGHSRTRTESQARARDAAGRIRAFGGSERDASRAYREEFTRDRRRATSSPETTRAWEQARSSYQTRRAGGEGGLGAAAGSVRAFNESLRTSITTQGQFNQAVVANARAMGSAARFGMSMAADGAARVGSGVGSGIGRLARSGLGLVGGVGGAGMIGGFMAYNAVQESRTRREEERQAFTERDVNTVLNRYRESSGLATEPQMTHGSMGTSLSGEITAGTVSMDQASQITPDDIAAANASRDSIIHRYQTSQLGGDKAGQVASQIMATSVGPLTPQEVATVKVDLLRQFSKDLTDDIIQTVISGQPESTLAGAQQTGEQRAEALRSQVTGVIEAPGAEGTRLQNLVLGGSPGFDDLERKYNSSLPSWLNWGPSNQFGPGGPLYKSELTPEQTEGLTAISDSIAAGFKERQQEFGDPYAAQERLKDYENVLNQFIEAGADESYLRSVRQFTFGLTGEEHVITPKQINEAGGFAEAVAEVDDTFAAGLKDLRAAQREAGGELEAERQQSPTSRLISDVSPRIGELFDSRGESEAQKAVTAYMDFPESVASLDKAVTESLRSMTSGFNSVKSNGEEMVKVLNAVPVDSDQFRLVSQMQARQQFAIDARGANLAPAQALGERIEWQGVQATQDAQNQTQEAQKVQAQQGVIQSAEAARAQMVQRLTMQREYEVAVDRTKEDYGRSKWQSVQDFGRQRGRMIAAGELQVERTQEDFDISTERAETDYGTSVLRARRDFQTQYERTMEDHHRSVTRQTEQFYTSLARMAEDYNIQVSRAHRDFNISMDRAEEDYQTGRERQAEDYNTSVARATSDFQLTMSRGLEDYHSQRRRSIEDFNTSMARANTDYNQQMARANEDFNLARQRSQKDFDKAMARQAEDAAKNMYSPYQRIQTQATWDARNLLVNLQEQNSAMEKQASQLDLARSMGLDQSVLDQLQLGEAGNAQQLDQLIRDMQTDPALAQEFNRMIQERLAAGGDVFEDESNVGRRRGVEDFLEQQKRAYDDHQKGMDRAREDFFKGQERANEDFFKGLARASEDFRKSNRRANDDFQKSMARGWEDYRKTLARGEEDYAKSSARSRADFAKSLRDMAEDHSRTVTRAVEDHNRGLRYMEENLQTSLERSSRDFHQAMADNAADFARTLERNQEDLNRSLDRMAADLALSLSQMTEDFMINLDRMDKAHARSLDRMAEDLARTDEVIAGDLESLGEQMQRALSGQSVEWQGIIVNNSEEMVKTLRTKVLPLYKEVMNDMGIDPKYFDLPSGGSGGRGGSSGGSSPRQALAEGGMVQGWSPHPTADNIDVKGTAGEFMQPVSTVNYYGADFMEQLRTRSIPREALTGDGDDPPRQMTWLDVDKLLSVLDQDRKGIYGGMREGTRDAMDDAYGIGMNVGDMPTGNWNGSGMPWRAIWSLIQKVAPEAYMTSNYRPGAITASGFVSYHGRDGGRAVDIASANMAATFMKLRPLLPWSELYYSPMDWLQLRQGRAHRPTGITRRNHFDHIHAAYDEGGWMEPGVGTYLNGTGKPEPVLTHDQWSDLSQLVESVGRMVTADDSRMLRASQGTPMIINNNQSYSYDNRNDFADSQITVISNDPDDMATKLEDHRWRGRLTQTRGVPR